MQTAEKLTPKEQRLVTLQRLNLTQGQAAVKMGISRTHFNRLFNQPKKHRHFDLRLQGLLRSQRVKAEREEVSGRGEK